MLKFFKIIIFSVFITIYSQAQIVINEMSTNNYATYIDNDGDYEDWIELYNAGGASVNLLNYRITDDVLLPSKWIFPSISIAAGGYLTLFASGKNKVEFTDHWESLVLENNSWKYTVPTAAITGWNTNGFVDAAWSNGNGGIGYADGDDNTLVTNPTTTVYARRTFNIVDASAIQSLQLYMDYDDGFVAYLNGVEISRSNLSASPIDYTSFADSDREAVMYTGGNPTAFAIPKTLFQPLLVNGNNVLAIEIHNKSAVSSDLSMRPFLLAGINNATVNYQTLPSWFVPPIASNSIHTNFKLSASGETVVLYNASGTAISNLTSPAMSPNDTWGRFPNGSATNRLLQPATPNATNGTATSSLGYWTDVVSMAPVAGYYAGTQSVTLSALNGASVIRYTLDGTKPNTSSTVYSGPISVASTMVVRAAAFNTGYIAAKFETNTYFINDNTTIPVISISTAPANFFSTTTGIYVDGPNAGTCPLPYQCYNYWQDWEPEVHIEYFDKTKVFQFEQDAGVKILGGYSRTFAMKSLQVRAGDQYGKKKFSYPLFTETKKSQIQDVESFTLRNGGNDFNYTMLRDVVNHRVLNSLQPCINNYQDFEGYEPVLVYINGVYWGLHTLRERVDNSYFDNNAGLGKNEFNSGETGSDGSLATKDGSIADFNALLSFVNTNVMNNANYTTVKGWLDIQNFVDYFSAEIFHTNWDWPHNNVKFFRPVTGGKWRYIYHDTDFAYGIFGGAYSSPTTNEFNRIMVTELTRSAHAPLFTKLLTNAEFKNYYINRSADLLNTIYSSPYLKTFYDGLENQLSPEMTRHFVKWPQNVGNVAGWTGERTYVKNFMDNRVTNIRSQLTSNLSAGAQVTVTLATSPVGAGKIKISTITPCSLPWTGVYFNGVPVTMEVIPNEGYVFTNWLSNTLITTPNINKSITMNITSSDVFTAYFNTTTAIPKLTITELNYHSDTIAANNIDSGDWIELLNSGNTPMDLSGYVLKDSKPYHSYALPIGTILGVGQYLVIATSLTKFQSRFPLVTNVIGSTVFDFNNGGETISITDPFGGPVLSFTYSDNAPWPTLADGLGTTMERVMAATDLNAAATWFDGCRQGSPGKAYSPCPCLNVNLGPDAVLCTSGGTKLLSTGLSSPHTNRKFYWYKDGVALAVPFTSSTLNAASIGLYKVLVDSMGCFKTDLINLVADLTFDLGSPISLCTPTLATLNSGLPVFGVTYSWTKDAVIISGATGPSYTATAAGVYVLTASAAGCTNKTDNITVSTVTATPNDSYKCLPATATLSVTGPGTSYKWYTTSTLGASFYTGASYANPSNYTNQTTYYIEDGSFFGGYVGPVDSTFGNLSQWVDNNMSAYRFRFNVLKVCILNYVTVYTNGPQNVKITIYDAATGLTPLFTRTVPVTTSGIQRIPLGFSLPIGTGYYMDANGSTGQLYYNHDNASFPYTEAGGYINITGTSPSWVGATNFWYPYIYKWEFSNIPGPCDRVPVTIYNTCPLPVELISFTGKRLENDFVQLNWETASELNSAYYLIEKSLDGVHFETLKTVLAKGTTAVITSYSFVDIDAYESTSYYRLKVVDNDHSFIYSNVITLFGNSESRIVVSPNPSELNFELLVKSNETERVNFTITDLSGKEILFSDNYFTNEKISFGGSLPSGTFLLKVKTSSIQNTSRIVKY